MSMENEEIKDVENSFQDESNLTTNQQLNKNTNNKTHFKSESFLFLFLLIISIFLISNFYITSIVLTPIKVVGESMQPTINASIINDNDEEHCDIVYYKQQPSYTNCDIIIVSNTNHQYLEINDVNYLIKRVIACPGDKIKFIPKNQDNEKIFYEIQVKDENGNIKISNEDYINGDMQYEINNYNILKSITYQTFSNIFNSLKNFNSYEMTISEGHYFVMGDNRNNSVDSRIFGEVAYEDICGKVEIQVKYNENFFTTLKNKFKFIIESII